MIDRPAWFDALTGPRALAEFDRQAKLVAAARAVVEERDRFKGDDKLDTIDEAIERLRKALK